MKWLAFLMLIAPCLAYGASTPTSNAVFRNATTLQQIGAGPNDTLTYRGQPIQGGGYAGGSPGVTTFNGRTGNVLPRSNDYSIGQISGASTVAGTGSYLDLSNKPTIPAAQVNADWFAASGISRILNKPTLPASASCATGYHVSGYNPATGAFSCTADTGAGSSLTYAQFVQMELIARPYQAYFVIDTNASIPGSAPDSNAAAEIAQLESWGVQSSHIKRIAPGPAGAGGTFVVQSLTSPTTMDNVTLTQAGGTLLVDGMTSTVSMDSITLVNPAVLNLAIADMSSTTTLDGVTLVQAGGTLAVADLASSSSLDNVAMALAGGLLTVADLSSNTIMDNVALAQVVAPVSLFGNAGLESSLYSGAQQGNWWTAATAGASGADGFAGSAVAEQVAVGSTGLDGSLVAHLKAMGGDNYDSGGGTGGPTPSSASIYQQFAYADINNLTGSIGFKVRPVHTQQGKAGIKVKLFNASNADITVTTNDKNVAKFWQGAGDNAWGSAATQVSGTFTEGVVGTYSLDLKGLVNGNGATGIHHVQVYPQAYDNSDLGVSGGGIGSEFYIDSFTGSTVATVAPTTPVITVTAGNNQNTIDLSTGGTVANSYDLHWGTTSGSRTSVISGITLPYVHTGFPSGSLYYSLVANNPVGSTESAETGILLIDNFNLANGSAPDPTLWASPVVSTDGTIDAASFFNIQSGAMEFNAKLLTGTIYKRFYPQANAFTVSTGRLIQWGYNGDLLTGTTVSNQEMVRVVNATDYAPDASGVPTKNFILIYIGSSGGGVAQNNLYIRSINSSGVDTGATMLVSNISSTPHDIKMVLTSATQVQIYVDGASVGTFNHTATLGTTAKAWFGLQIASVNTSFTDIKIPYFEVR